MGLGGGQDPTVREVALAAARAAYRMVIDSLEVDESGVVRVQGEREGGAPIQATHLDLAFPFGNYSRPPADVEGVAVHGDPKDAVVAVRDPEIPADLRRGGSQEVAAGENSHFGRGGAYVKYGSKGRLGKQGSVTPEAAIARKGDSIKSTSAPGEPLGGFDAWAAAVEANLNAKPGPAFPPALSWTLLGPHIGDIDDAGAGTAGSPNWDCD